MSHEVKTQKDNVLSEGLDIKALALALLLMAGLLLVLAGLTLFTQGQQGHFMIVAPLGWDRFESLSLIRETDGQIISMGGMSNILIVASEAPDFEDKVRAAGAWIVMNAPVILGCGDELILEAKV